MKTQKDKTIALKIGARIKALRKNRRLTQEKLGELSGLEYKHIQLLESNSPPNPRIDSIYNIARAFGISLHEFFSDEMFQEKPNEPKKKHSPFKAKSSSRKNLFENSYWFALYHHPPFTRGHVVIYCKRDVQNYFELYPEEVHALEEITRQVYQFLNVEFKPDGFNIGMDIGEYAGQELELVTLHVIPRYRGDTRNPLASGMKKVLGV